MIPFDELEYHPTSEKLVDIICSRTQSQEPLFFRVLVGYYFSAVAAHMRCFVDAPVLGGDIPVNMYALNLAPSGFGKGRSTNIIENEVIHLFRGRFLEETFPLLAQDNLPKLAVKRAARKGTDPDHEQILVEKEFDSCGEMLFSFCDATTPAVKQLRHKLLMADAGSLNLEIDEIGLNLQSAAEVLTTFLELYDKGLTKTKLTKNTADSRRMQEIRGMTPANMMMFGAPSKLFDGSTTEQMLYSLLDTGYARRCFFGYIKGNKRAQGLTAKELYENSTNPSNKQFVDTLADHLENMADIINVGRRLKLNEATSLTLLEYKIHCEQEADKLPEHEEMRKAEISHRYFKVLKLAGAYAFIDDSTEVTEGHIYNAIKMAEECGQAFNMMLNRDRPYVKLAKYLADVNREVTQAELVEDLPFYKGGVNQRNEMLTLATAYGYKNNIVIKKSFTDGIEFLRGETLKQTDLSRMILSYSNDIARDYVNEYAPFDKLFKLTQAQGMHWVAHHLQNGHRSEENAIPGFNLVVIDVDGTCSMATAKLLLKDYKFLLYTTKRHTEAENRFRIILPINYELRLDAKDYKEFMSNLFDWLPFEVDKGTNQRARKWLSHEGHYEYNEGEILDALPFIPKTSKNEQRKELLSSQQSLDNLERWILNNSGDGNRNNMLLRYAMILLDTGLNFESIRLKVMELNNKMPDKLEESEILGTIMITVSKQMAKR